MSKRMVELLKEKGRIGALQYWLVKRNQLDLGEWGEWIALKHLMSQRFDVIARNWKIKHGEIDLIAYDGDHLVIVEVKTRKCPTRLPPEINVNDAKRSQLEFLAHSFLNRYELTDVPVRFDLIAIETPDRRDYEIRHYRGFM
jgi:putative endonuclease